MTAFSDIADSCKEDKKHHWEGCQKFLDHDMGDVSFIGVFPFTSCMHILARHFLLNLVVSVFNLNAIKLEVLKYKLPCFIALFLILKEKPAKHFVKISINCYHLKIEYASLDFWLFFQKLGDLIIPGS